MIATATVHEMMHAWSLLSWLTHGSSCDSNVDGRITSLFITRVVKTSIVGVRNLELPSVYLGFVSSFTLDGLQ